VAQLQQTATAITHQQTAEAITAGSCTKYSCSARTYEEDGICCLVAVLYAGWAGEAGEVAADEGSVVLQSAKTQQQQQQQAFTKMSLLWPVCWQGWRSRGSSSQ
jgi:hypothetical protein